MDADDVVIAQAEGRLGSLTVREGAGVRSLWCDGFCQGAVFIEPGVVHAGIRHAPGPVPDAPYQLGWLLAGLAAPTGHLLMAGLGAGSGICSLLHHFPDLRVTVVEIDPAVVDLALAHWPLLAALVTSGRCTVVVAAFADHLVADPAAHWDAALLDTYDAGGRIDCPPAVLTALHGRVDACWLNVAEPDGLGAGAAIDLLAATGWVPRTAAVVRFSDDGFAGNVLIGTAAVDLGQALALELFPDLDHPHAQRARDDFAALLAGSFILA